MGSNIQLANTTTMVKSFGYLPVGEYVSGVLENKMTPDTCKANGIEVMAKAYTGLQKADAVVKRDTTWGHTMMIVENHPVITADGSIDPAESYVTVLHQTSSYMKKEAKVFDPAYGEDVYIIYGIDDKYTYADLFDQGYLPITCDVFVDPAPVDEIYVRDTEKE